MEPTCANCGRPASACKTFEGKACWQARALMRDGLVFRLESQLSAATARVAELERQLADVTRYSEQLRFKARALAEFCKTYIAMPSDRLVSLADRVIDHVHSGAPAQAKKFTSCIQQACEPEKAEQMATPIMKYFVYEHLPQGPLRDTSQDICALAEKLDNAIPDGPEKSAGLRKLLEAKDCLVRAMIT